MNIGARAPSHGPVKHSILPFPAGANQGELCIHVATRAMTTRTASPATISAALETYYATRAARTGVSVPSLFHISFNIGGRVVSDKVRGYMGAVARLDILVEQAEAEEFQRTRKIALAYNCKVREMAEVDDLTRAMEHEFAVRTRIQRWGC